MLLYLAQEHQNDGLILQKHISSSDQTRRNLAKSLDIRGTIGENNTLV